MWPTADPFDDGSPVAKKRGYYSVILDSGTNYQYGSLHNGYEPTGGYASSVRDSTGGNDGKSIGFVRRQEFIADCTATVVLSKRSVAGAVDANAVNRQGVIARMSAAATGPLVSATYPRFSWMASVTAYTFELRSAGGSNLKLGLYRYDAGTEVVLVESAAFAATSAGWNLRSLMQLTVTTTGGNAVLSGSIGLVSPQDAGNLFNTYSEPGGTGAQQTGASSTTGATIQTGPFVAGDPRVGGSSSRAKHQSGAPPVPPNETTPAVEVLTHTDSSGSKITAGGRCGFVVDDEADVPGTDGGTWVSGVESFEVSQLAASVNSVLWRDEFVRAEPSLAQSLSDALGNTGSDLTSDYSCDEGGVVATGPYANGAAGDVTVAGITDLGNAPDLPGTALTNDTLVLASPAAAMQLPPALGVLEVTVAIWANIDTNRNGNCLWLNRNSSSFTEGFRFGWITSGSNMLLRVEMRDASGTTQVIDTPAVATTNLLNSTRCWVFTWKANANTDGTGRLRIYRGRFGDTTLLQETNVASTCKPAWEMTEHRIGDTGEASASVADRYLDGTVDRLSIYYKELTDAQVSSLSNELASDALVTSLGAVHSCDFENSTTDATHRTFPVSVPATATGTWKVGIGATLATGLVTTVAATMRHMLHQRPPETLGEQSRTATLQINENSGRAGIFVLGAGISGGLGTVQSDKFITGGTYYAVTVGVGSPAPVYVDRVVDGTLVHIAKENPSTSTRNVVVGTNFALIVSVTRANAKDPASASVLAVKIDGTLVPLVATANDPAVAVSSDSHIVDSSLLRVTSGYSTGLIMTSTTGVLTRILDFSNAATIGGDSVSSNTTTLKAVLLPFEDEGATGDLGAVLDEEWGVVLSSASTRMDSTTEDYRTVRTVKSTYERRQARLSSSTLTDTQAEAFRAFYEAHKGREIPFDFNSLSDYVADEPNGKWRFRSDTLSDGMTGRGTRRLQVEIEEVVQTPSGVVL